MTKHPKIKIGDVSFPLEDYAVVGNAVLGTKGAGKTFLAKSIAEQMLDAGIPIIALDPIGVWRHLRRGRTSRSKGYKIVVAGGYEPDLPLTPDSAYAIVNEAMSYNIPLVIDLYDPNLSKADWRKIVRSTFHALLYRNEGLRHVFLEETAEFAPQQVYDGETYAAVEKLVRMGGNVSVGVTLINQRAQEVNKAVLDLCENLIVMRQRGAKAIEQLTKWFEHLDRESAKAIGGKLSQMKVGDAWIFTGEGEPPAETRCGQIRTFHPDRKRPELLERAGATADAGEFVSVMHEQLDAMIEQAKANDPKALKARIRELERQLAAGGNGPDPDTAEQLRASLERERAAAEALRAVEDALSGVAQAQEQAGNWLTQAMEGTTQALKRGSEALKAAEDAPAAPPARPANGRSAARRKADAATSPPAPGHAPRQEGPQGRLTGPQQRLLDALAWWEAVGVAEPDNRSVAFLCGYAPTSGGFTEPRGNLRSMGLIEYTGTGRNRLTAEGRKLANRPARPGTLMDLHEAVRARLPGPETRMLDELLRRYPKSIANDELAAWLGYAPTSGGFTEPRGVLKRLGLAVYAERGTTRAADFLFPDSLR